MQEAKPGVIAVLSESGGPAMKRLKAQSFRYSPNQEKYFDVSAPTESIEDSASSQGQVLTFPVRDPLAHPPNMVPNRKCLGLFYMPALKDLEDFIQTDSSNPWFINQKARKELQKQLYTR